jgi:SMODS and SLOG-associating 2TM effector domain family 5
MKVSGNIVQPSLRLVVSSVVPVRPDDRASQVPRLQVVIDDQRRLQLIDTMTLVGSARSHAARRLAHKQALARWALTLLIANSVYIWSWIALNAASPDPPAHRRLAFVAIISAVAALMLSCCRSEGRAAVAAHQLRVCAAEISELGARLSAGRSGADADSVHEIRELYRDAMRRCTADHRYVDYLAARLATDGTDASRWRLNFYYLIDVYPVPVAALSLPLGFAMLA